MKRYMKIENETYSKYFPEVLYKEKPIRTRIVIGWKTILFLVALAGVIYYTFNFVF